MTRFLLTLDQSIGLVLHAMTHAQGGELFVRKAPACTVQALAEAMRLKYSPKGAKHRIKITGIRPGEKIHETLVNEYEIQRSVETKEYFHIYPEYRLPERHVHKPLGEEYTSASTNQLTTSEEIEKLLDAMGQVEFFI
jgi:FlaA1/EpsC-like NDP-sugar epimerase